MASQDLFLYCWKPTRARARAGLLFDRVENKDSTKFCEVCLWLVPAFPDSKRNVRSLNVALQMACCGFNDHAALTL